MSSESLPTRTNDLRFLALDECDRLAQANGEIVMRKGFEFQIVGQRSGTTTIDAAYLAASWPRTEWDTAAAKRIRDLDFVPSSGFVIAEI